MRKRQRSRWSSWGEFHAIQKVLNAATETGGLGALGRDGGLVHSRCNITSRTKIRQEQILDLRERNGGTRGEWNVASARTRPRSDQPIRIRGSARASGARRKTPLTNF